MRRTYNILDYGAEVSDRLSTCAIQSAINDCYRNGGGEVLIPEGFFRTGAIRLLSGVTLHLLSGAFLEGSEDPDDYSLDYHELEPYYGVRDVTWRSSDPLSRWSHGLICARGAHDIGIIGEPYSCIDGSDVFDAVGEDYFRGPHGINLWDCRNVTLRGYTLRNTGNWAHAIFRSENVAIRNVTVYAGHDGVDLFLCENTVIESCRLATGDDAIAGFGSKRVTIRDCVLDTACSILRFGGTDVLVERCTAASPAPYAHRCTLSKEERARSAATTAAHRHNTTTVFLYYCDKRFGALPYEPGSITIRDCTFENVYTLFNMDFGRHKWCCNAPLRSITFENCRLNGAKQPIYIHGDPEKPIEFVLKNVTLSADETAKDVPFLDAENFSLLRFDHVNLEGYASPHIILRSEGEMTAEDTAPFTVENGLPGQSTMHGH